MHILSSKWNLKRSGLTAISLSPLGACFLRYILLFKHPDGQKLEGIVHSAPAALCCDPPGPAPRAEPGRHRWEPALPGAAELRPDASSSWPVSALSLQVRVSGQFLGLWVPHSESSCFPRIPYSKIMILSFLCLNLFSFWQGDPNFT